MTRKDSVSLTYYFRHAKTFVPCLHHKGAQILLSFIRSLQIHFWRGGPQSDSEHQFAEACKLLTGNRKCLVRCSMAFTGNIRHHYARVKLIIRRFPTRIFTKSRENFYICRYYTNYRKVGGQRVQAFDSKRYRDSILTRSARTWLWAKKMNAR